MIHFQVYYQLLFVVFKSILINSYGKAAHQQLFITLQFVWLLGVFFLFLFLTSQKVDN